MTIQSSAQSLPLRVPQPIARPSERGGARDFLSRLLRARLAGVGLIIIFVFTTSAIFAENVSPYSSTKTTLTNRLKPPSEKNLLGTDELGRDILSRVIYGGRVSLQVGVVSVGIALLVGVMLGLIAGYWSNSLLDNVIMRLMDALLSFPAIVLALAIVATLGASKEGEIPKSIWAIGIVTVPAYARLTRGQVLTVREREYVLAAHTVGAPDARIMLRHILPNVTAPLIVQSSLGIAGAILTEAALSFLGLGVQPPTPSWGSMLSAGRGYLDIDPWLVVGPGAAIFLTVLGFNFLGDGIRDVLDPTLRNV
ncbi:MAG: ABC transporter permease [Chloroflexi bacterium]|nr:ABC transporter permease [Chloroflexota bacterium]